MLRVTHEAAPIHRTCLGDGTASLEGLRESNAAIHIENEARPEGEQDIKPLVPSRKSWKVISVGKEVMRVRETSGIRWKVEWADARGALMYLQAFYATQNVSMSVWTCMVNGRDH